jgi:hypothetical protein
MVMQWEMMRENCIQKWYAQYDSCALFSLVGSFTAEGVSTTLVSYRLRGSDALWCPGIMREQAVADVSTYGSRGGGSFSSVQALLPMLSDVCTWANQQFGRGRG